MAKIIRKTGDVKAFASNATSTNRTVFGAETQSDTLDDNVTAELLTGWQIVGANEKPTLQDYNAAGFTAGQYIAYLHQIGLAEWDGAQQYQINSFANRGGVIYRCKTADHTSATVPESDATNWENILASKASLAGATFTGQAKGITPVSGEDFTRKDYVDGLFDTATITGSTVFTQSTNNIGLTGIGSIGLAVGDVITVSGASSNNKDFTVEVITNTNNIIVNQAHAGGATTKSLVNQTATATITLLVKAASAGLGVGQGWCEPSRSAGVVYTNATKRTIGVNIYSDATTTLTEYLLEIDSLSISSSRNFANNSTKREQVGQSVPSGSIYEFTLTGGNVDVWSELR
jgi:hypothetical protein